MNWACLIDVLSEPLLSRFLVMYLNEYGFSQFYEIAVKKLLDEGLNKYQRTVGTIQKDAYPGMVADRYP
jgi:hypothetical protein